MVREHILQENTFYMHMKQTTDNRYVCIMYVLYLPTAGD
jgi:hypothetical protein